MSEHYGIRIIDESFNIRWFWVRGYNPDAFGGGGHIDFTTKHEMAMRFASIEDAIAAYRTQSTVRPLREDGLPNRPLTAYSVSIERLPSSKECEG